LINDIDDYSKKLLVHEIALDRFFFTKEAQIRGERSYDRVESSPMKNQLKADQIAMILFKEKVNSPFLNEKTIGFGQITRLV